MTKCTLAGRQYLDDWKLLTAFPIKVVTAPSKVLRPKPPWSSSMKNLRATSCGSAW